MSNREGQSLPILWVALLCVSGVLSHACAGYELYWGDVHVHTEFSDGKGSPTEVLSYARDVAGLDFVILTDHDFGNGPPWRLPTEDWNRTQDAVEAFTENGVFVAIAGYEWTSQPKYWPEGHLPGKPRNYNHKNVYFPARVEGIFISKDKDYMSPDLLAKAVEARGGLIHNCHPNFGPEWQDQWAFEPLSASVITNSEMRADIVHYEGKTHVIRAEEIVRGFLNGGGRTGFVLGSDSHDGRPAMHTAVYARSLCRAAIFEALRRRRNYAVSGAAIVLDFKIDGHFMGEEIETEGPPRLKVVVEGTEIIDEVAIIRDGKTLRVEHPKRKVYELEFKDRTFSGQSYYYVRVTQADSDEHGNPSCAWSSPIWVRNGR